MTGWRLQFVAMLLINVDIDESNCNILTRLNISPENWLKLTTQFKQQFKNAVGVPDSISKYCKIKNYNDSTTFLTARIYSIILK